MDGCHIRLSQNLMGILQACLLVLAMIGYLHEFLQIVASTLAGDILMTELHSLEESILGHLIVLFLQGIHGLDMQHDVVSPVAVLIACIGCNLIGYLVGLVVVLMGSLENGLVTPGRIEQAFIALLLAL